MVKKEYDETIASHYKDVASEHGLSSTSTMMDEITRAKETDAIEEFVWDSLGHIKATGLPRKATIMDIGCGNGHTLSQLFNKYPEHNYVGIEMSDELRALALKRFKGNDSIQILEGDIREKNFSNGIEADILICQRVLINLLNIEDQKSALLNIIDTVKSPDTWTSGGGCYSLRLFVAHWRG